MESSKQKKPLTDTEKDFIHANFRAMTFTAMARKLHRIPKLIGDYMDENGLEKMKTPRQPDTHPFRRANVSLKKSLDALRHHAKVAKHG